AGLDAADAPRLVAEQKDVTGHALDGEVLVDAADKNVGRLLDDIVVGGIGNGAAAGDRREARAAARPQHLVNAVAMQMRRSPTTAGCDALAQHLENGLEVGAS